MPTCEHFIYTTAKTPRKTGYQVVAKSNGITENTISSLSEYLFPLGVNPSEFKKSKSLTLIGKEKIVYSIVKNIGIGYDGRAGTLYNHTIIISMEDFEKIDFDSRVFDEYFIDDYNIRGELDKLYIQPTRISPNYDYLEKLDDNLLSALLYALFRRSKIAIIKPDEPDLIQNLLAIIPPQIRLIPFSTLVIQPERQRKYNLIQIPNNVQPKLDPSFVIINPLEVSRMTKRQLGKDVGIQNLIDIIHHHDEKQLKKLHQDFKKISVHVSKNKRIKVGDIFDTDEFENLSEIEDFATFERKVKRLYASPDFNQSSPRVMVSITKKMRKIIKKALKNQKKIDPYESSQNMSHLISITKILLDCLHYIQEYSEKKIGNTIESEIPIEIMRLKEILDEYPTALMGEEYKFSPYEYFKTVVEQSLHAWYSFGLWVLGRRWR